MEWAAREAAHFPAAMMELKRVAAPNGRQPAWLRRHRMTGQNQGQRQTMHAASGKPTRVGSAGLRGDDCGPGPAKGGGAASRSIFASCSLKRASSSPRARDLFVGLRELFIGARDQGIVGFSCFWSGCGAHWRLAVQCRPMATVGYASLIVNQEDCVARAFACYAVNDRGAGRSPVRSRLRRPR